MTDNRVANLARSRGWRSPDPYFLIEGSRSIEDRIIRREVKFRPESVFDPALLEQSREALMKTGILKKVSISHGPSGNAGYVDIHIHIHILIMEN